MLIGRIHGATRVLGKPADMTDEECGPLAIRDTPSEQGNVMVSAWIPTPDELVHLAQGAPIYLYVWGNGHPPVAIEVGEPT